MEVAAGVSLLDAPAASRPETLNADTTYQVCRDDTARLGPVELGPMIGHAWRSDPKRLTFTLSRYKFVSKMLANYQVVAEVGAGDGFASAIVAEQVGRLDLYDIDARMGHGHVEAHDLVAAPLPATYDAIYALDVLEHVEPVSAPRFLNNAASSLRPHGALILGMPSIESQKYASEISRAGHVNCVSGEDLRNFCTGRFHHVFMFGMNDEVVHTGFLPMSHYLLALCCDPRR